MHQKAIEACDASNKFASVERFTALVDGYINGHADASASHARLVAAARKSLEQFQYMLEQMGPTLDKEPYTGAGSEVSTRMDELCRALAEEGVGR